MDQFARAVWEHFGGAIKNLPAIVGGGLAPAVRRCARGDHRIAKILARGMGEIVKLFARRRFRREIAAALAAWKFSADEKLVGFFDVEAMTEIGRASCRER